ncbi:MAG TPA: glycosyltransferase [Gemmatimonadales bacterium]|nr:glycosyltransferase [Gemmatimonadales bacterium]
MKLSVAICTWNRCDMLRQTLERMIQLEVPPEVSWELLVVNNNSSDGTDGVVAAFDGALPLRALTEPTPGKSHALNRAVAAATGDYILFTDDDVLVDPRWLAAYVEAFRRWPDAAVFGGPIEPWFAGDPPPWLARTFHQVEYAFAALDLGGEPRPLGGFDVPFGANMAMRMKEQRERRYDPRLGPRPESGLRGEEITLVKQLLAEGAHGWWVPGARVKHYIPAARQRVSYIRDWYHGWGEYLARTSPAAGGTALGGRPLWLWREMLESECRFRLRRLVARPEVWVEDLKAAATAWGRFRAYGAPPHAAGA